MSTQTETQPSVHIGKNSAVLMPNRYKDCQVAIQRNLPGVVILVHGVNDVGVAYAAQDNGLCIGLNERLNRPDLFPNDFRLPAEGDAVQDDPDAIYYQRLTNERTNSPVIHFFWGYKATEEDVAKEQVNEQNVDNFGNRLDRRMAKEGGMFSNATSSIPDMFNGQFEGGFAVWMTNTFVADKIHIVAQAPDRHYMALAAKRLAALIKQIREKEPNDTITLLGHSQGCLIALAAQAFLHTEGARSADCLIMQHPPYGLYEPWLDRAVQSGQTQQTTQARVETLIALVKLITGHEHTVPDWKAIKADDTSRGRFGDKWTPTKGKRPGIDGDPADLVHEFEERSNRGRVYLYFCPHDMTVGLASVQGIGTLGVPATVRAEQANGTTQDLPVLSELGSGFKQRVWTWKRHSNGKQIRVGEAPGVYTLRGHGDPAYDGGFFETFGRTPLTKGEPREISGEALNPPFAPNLHHSETKKDLEAHPNDPRYVGNLYLDPIDACDAVVKEGVHNVPVDGSPYNPSKQYEPGELRRQTPSEARLQYQSGDAVPNSYHSSIPGEQEHHRWVTAMDVAIGQANMLDDRDWRELLLMIADWRLSFTEMQKNKYFADLLPSVRDLVEATCKYYDNGIFPELYVPKTPPAPIVSQTRAQRAELAPIVHRAHRDGGK